jgi:hypothetical protein
MNPLERYGVGLSEAAVKSYAFANGIAEVGTELTQEQKVMARLGLLMEQTNKVQGDFVNTSDALANSSRITKAQLENAAATLGEDLIPLAAKGVGIISAMVNAFNALSPAGQDAALVIAAIAAGTGPMLMAIGNSIKAYTTLTTAVRLLDASLKATLVTAGAVTLAIAAIIGVGLAVKYVADQANQGAEKADKSWGGFLQRQIDMGADTKSLLDAYAKKQAEVNKIIEEADPITRAIVKAKMDDVDVTQKLQLALLDTASSYEEYIDAADGALDGATNLTTQQRLQAEALWASKGATDGLVTALMASVPATTNQGTAASTSATAHDQYNTAISNVALATERQAQAAADAAVKNQEMFDSVNRGLDSMIENWLADLEWMQSGGLLLQQQFADLQKAFYENPDDPDIKREMQEVYLNTIALKSILGEIDATAAAQNIADTLGISIEDALLKLGNLKAEFAAGGTMEVKIIYNDPGWTPPNAQWGAGKPGGKGRARGGRVYQGQIYDVGEYGREPFIPEQDGRILSTRDAMRAYAMSTAPVSMADGSTRNNSININFGAVNISNGMDMAVFQTLIQQTVRQEFAR